MAVEMNNTAQKLDFGSILSGITNKTMIGWVNPSSFPASFGGLFGKSGAGSAAGFSSSLGASGFQPGRLFFHEKFSTTVGDWYSNTALTANTLNHFAITYTSTTAAPLMYLAGVVVGVTTLTPPAGSLVSDAGVNFVLGDFDTGSGTEAIMGKIFSFLIYNRILSAAEIADAYASKLAIPTYQGLVFAPNLMGAAGGVSDGSTLAAANTIVDQISGAYGVPSGSPVLRADTALVME